jgi:hypothetical protein
MPLHHFQFINNTRSADGGVLDLANDDAAQLEAEMEASELLSHPGEGDWSRWTIVSLMKGGGLLRLFQSLNSCV